MNITFLWNSFIYVEIGDSKIVCDPWINEFHRDCGWLPPKDFHKNSILKYVSDANFIFISHIHFDHFDPTLLGEINCINDEIVFLIPKLNNKRLYNKLSNTIKSTSRIIELKPFEVKSFSDGDFEIISIPQMSEFTCGLPGISYDLDSSVIIKDNLIGGVFFNSVDNPLSETDYSEIKKSLPYEDIDLATFTGAAASHYPQSFLGIDREKERVYTKSSIYNKTIKCIRALNPKRFTFCGGTYSLAKSIESLEQYKAFLTADDARKISSETDKEFIDIIDKHAIHLSNTSVGYANRNSIYHQIIPEKVNEKQKPHELSLQACISPTDCYSDDLDFLRLANASFLERVKSIQSMCDLSSLNIKFFSYEKNINLISNNHYLEIQDTPLYSYILEGMDRTGNANKLYEYHLQRNLLMSSVKGDIPWDSILTSSLCLIRRSPNDYIPVEEQIINFFRI